jgi:ABC-type nitrate/sulfonate/bicarbonate transport system substrate-binding protein
VDTVDSGIIKLGVFTPSVILDVARHTGRLDAAGVVVQEHAVSSSPAQFEALESGTLDLAVTSPDNVLLYAGFADNPRGHRLPLTITAALDRGLGLSLWTRPGIALSEARVLGVDVPVSGFALAARALLARLGVDPEALKTVSLGSTPRRREALSAGNCDVTILGAGNELRAEEEGCHRVASVGELGDYLGAVTCRLATASPDRARAADAVANALVETGTAIAAGRHDGLVVEAAKRLLGLSPASARRHLEVLRSPHTGVVAGGRLDRSTIETLARLRRRRHDEATLAAAVDLLIATASGRAA